MKIELTVLNPCNVQQNKTLKIATCLGIINYSFQILLLSKYSVSAGATGILHPVNGPVIDTYTKIL